MVNILLVEDDKAIVSNLTTFSAWRGVPCGRRKRSRRRRAKFWPKNTYDLVLLDISLGGRKRVCPLFLHQIQYGNTGNFPHRFGDEYSVVTGLDMGRTITLQSPFGRESSISPG